MYQTHKIALIPTNVQATGLAKACGCARFAYNWALSEWQLQYDFYRQFPHLINKPSQSSLRKELNSIKAQEFPWLLDSTKCAPQEAPINLGRAFNNFFKGTGNYPKYKKKGVHESFTLSSGNFAIRKRKNSTKDEIRIPKIGWLKLSEHLRFTGKLISCTISKVANKWFTAITVDTFEVVSQPETDKIIGIDVGVREYADSNGNIATLPRSYRKNERKLRRAQQSLARKKKGGKNRRKAKAKVAKIHANIRNIRQDFLHKFTHKLVHENQVIAIEDLNVKGMHKNKKLAKSLADASFGEFRRQIEYKANWYHREVIAVDRWYPSSKICSQCGIKTNQKMSLNIRQWTCEHCHEQHHRDINAARNLQKYAESSSATAYGQLLPLQ